MKAKNLSAALDSIMGKMEPKGKPEMGSDTRGRKLKYAEGSGKKANPFGDKMAKAGIKPKSIGSKKKR